VSVKRIREINLERAEKGINIEAHPIRCNNKMYRGKRYHIPGVAVKFYSLTPKGRKAFALLKKLRVPEFVQLPSD